MKTQSSESNTPGLRLHINARRAVPPDCTGRGQRKLCLGPRMDLPCLLLPLANYNLYPFPIINYKFKYKFSVSL